MRSRVADWRSSGVVALTGRAGQRAGVPVGAGATTADRLAGWVERLSGAIGSPVRVHGSQLLAERAALTGWRGAGRCSAGGASRLLPAADGWVALSLPRPDDGALAAALVGDSEDLDPAAPWPGLRRWVSRQPAASIVTAAAELGLAVGQLAEAAPPAGGPGFAGGPLDFAEGQPGDSRVRSAPAAATPGVVDVAALVAAVTGGQALSVPSVPSVLPVPPLPRRLKVLDFSALWAGPLCAQLLGLAGADVVKFETPGRPDGARYGSAPFYDLLHAGHSSVCLDPANREELARLHALVEAADVIIEASRPRALAGWGLSVERAVARGTVWVSITAHGRSGAPAGRIGFGDDIAVAGGLVAWDDDGPIFAGDAIADPLAGLAAATGALLGVVTGGGQLVDVAMSQVVAATLESTCPPRPGRAADARDVADAHDARDVADAHDARDVADAHSAEGAPEAVGAAEAGAADVPVVAPVARAVTGRAPRSGADTADVLARWRSA